MTIKMVLASDTKGGIGLNNKLPWYCPEDLEYFKKVTSGSTVVMGRNTWISLQVLGMKNGLPDRVNKVITSRSKFLSGSMRKDHYIGMDVVKSKLLVQAKYYNDRVCIIGGKSIYDQLLPFVDVIHHTVISGEYECDTFMDVTQWTESSDWELKETKVLSDKAKVYIWRKV